MLGRRFEREDGQLCGWPGIEFHARFIPELGDAADQVAGVRVERPGLKPRQESLNDCVADLARWDVLARAPVREGSKPVRQALVADYGFQHWFPFEVVSCGPPAKGVDDAGKLKRGA